MTSPVAWRLFLLLFVGFIFLGVCAAEHVVTLDADNFDEVVNSKEFVLVEFYAPWCGHCKNLAPEYEEAAKILKKTEPNIVLAKVDGDDKKNKELSLKYSVQGFPTLKIFRNGVEAEYKGPRETQGIVEYVLKQAGPPSKELTTAEDVAAFIAASPVAPIGIFPSSDCPEFSAYLESANVLRAEYEFAHVTDPSLLPEQSVPAPVLGIRLFKQFDERFNDFAEFDIEKVKEFVELKSIPLIVEMTKEPGKMLPVLQRVFGSSKNKVILLFNYTDGSKDAFESEYREVASTFGGSDLYFIIGDSKENENAYAYFGIQLEDSPVIFLHVHDADKKYYETKITPGHIKPFMEDFKAGKLEPRVKSEPIPEDNDGPVKVVVAKTFEDVVLNSKKNVLLEFYAPGCGHCKKLAPVFEKVGEAFKDDGSVIVAKMDATANDIPSTKFKVEGYPTIYFVDAEGEVHKFDGSRSKKTFIHFVNTHKKEVSAGNISEEAAETVEAALSSAEKLVNEVVTPTGGKDEL